MPRGATGGGRRPAPPPSRLARLCAVLALHVGGGRRFAGAQTSSGDSGLAAALRTSEQEAAYVGRDPNADAISGYCARSVRFPLPLPRRASFAVNGRNDRPTKTVCADGELPGGHDVRRALGGADVPGSDLRRGLRRQLHAGLVGPRPGLRHVHRALLHHHPRCGLLRNRLLSEPAAELVAERPGCCAQTSTRRWRSARRSGRPTSCAAAPSWRCKTSVAPAQLPWPWTRRR